MISVEDSIPAISDTYLQGQDIFYAQFNDIDFYVEDVNQENFYLLILKKLFVNVTIGKIFPLNGKRNVIEAAAASNGDKKKIYVVDKDFDDILDRVEVISNLFYLDKYSIENYLIDFDSLKEYIVEEEPTINISSIDTVFNWDQFSDECVTLFHELCGIHLVVQKRCAHVPNVATKIDSFCFFRPPLVNQVQLNAYKNMVENEIKLVDKSLKFSIQLSKSMKQIGSSRDQILSNIPGKYLIKFLKIKTESTFSISKRNIGSFAYRLAKNSSLASLSFLKISIENFIK